jgi:ribosomal protein L12E/L44/L45/RPP1/RPP2
MSLRFRGGERLQRGRGIGGLLRLFKSVFSPLVKSAGKTIVKAATSDTGKAVLRNIKDQAIESGVRLATDALKGENMDESMQNEIQQVKRKAAEVIENVHSARKKQRKAEPKQKTKARTKAKPALVQVKPMNDYFG